MANASPHSWPADKVDHLAALHGEKLTSGAIALQLGVTRNAVMGQINRLRQAGDPRIAPAGPSAIATTPQRGQRRIDDMNSLAELVANGATLRATAAQLRISLEHVDALWARIRAGLGRQAA